jgi:hypothetical protein
MAAKAKKKVGHKSLRAAKKGGDKRGTNPKSLANLEAHRYPPGTSGNPGGVKKGLREAYNALLDEVDPQTGKTHARLIAEAVVKGAERGEVNAAHEVFSATENSKHELSGPGGGPIQIERTITADQLDDDELASIIANHTP